MAKTSSARTIALNDMNKRFAVVCIGGLVRIADFSQDIPRYLSVNDFKTLLDNIFVEEEAPTTEEEESKKPSRKKIASSWLSWKQRRQYESVDFAPNIELDSSSYNLWRGFKFEPKEGGKFDLFIDHVKTNI